MGSVKGTLHSAGGSQDVGLVKLSSFDLQQSNRVSTVTSTIPAHILAENMPPPSVQVKLPRLDERLDNTPQLVCCLGLLKMAQSPDAKFEPAALKWMRAVEKDKDEQERLHGIATGVIRAFKREEIKDAKVVAEVVCLAPILDKEMFHDLLEEFYSAVDHSGLLKFQQLEGLAQLIQGADQGHLNADDLVKILGLLSTRLMDTHQQSSQHMHQLTLAVSHVLDAMADTKVMDLDREKLHEPLTSYLSELKKSSDPFLVYQAAYAYQALLCVPDDETTWQAAMRRTGMVVQGVSGLVTAVKGLDLVKFMEGLENIQKGVSGASKVAGVVKSTYDKVTTLVTGGQSFMNSLKEGFSFERRRDWYSALRGADALIRDGKLATFRKLVCEAPCRCDPAFQWGVCQRLGEMAVNSKWDVVTRRGAVAFLGEIYRNDEMWGQQASVKQWILNILMQLSKSSEGSSQCMWNRSLADILQSIYIHRCYCHDLTEHLEFDTISSTHHSRRDAPPRIGSKRGHQKASPLSRVSGERSYYISMEGHSARTGIAIIARPRAEQARCRRAPSCPQEAAHKGTSQHRLYPAAS